VNVTASPTFGDDGEKSNAAETGGVAGAGVVTLTVRVACDDPPLPLTVSTIVYVPAFV
jgi:hypothetical protein